MERRKFEDSFQEAFKDAEMNPSEGVWTNIALDLERANGDKMKRRIVFFKMLAAASVIFALCVGGLSYYIFWDQQAGMSIAQQGTADENLTTDKRDAPAIEQEGQRDQVPGKVDNRAGEQSSSSLADPIADQTLAQQKNNTAPDAHDVISETDATAKGVEINSIRPGNTSLAENDVRNDQTERRAQSEQGTSREAFANTDNKQNMNDVMRVSDKLPLTSEESSLSKSAPRQNTETERKLPAFYQPAMPDLELPASAADPGMVLLARLADEEKKYTDDQKAKKSRSEKLWTSVGFAAGAFDANNPSMTPAPSNTSSFYSSNSTLANTAIKQSRASGTSYSLGVSLGTQISERWVMQGGINYLTQSSDYTANSVVVLDNNYGSLKAESLNAFTLQTSDAAAQPKVAQTYPYNVNNNVRFVSVPVQAGYRLVNRKFGVQLNAGVSTDLFLQNTITPDGGGVTKTTQGRGDDSPYRSLNFSGLMGTELSYKLGSKYRVSVNPGLRYPFNSVYKESTGIDATPLTFDVGLRFRYIFH